jgi:transcriptional regulator GlxA family with amidase domain
VTSRPVALVTFPGVQMLDVAGPIEVFTIADLLLGSRHSHYQVGIIATRAGPVPCSNGFTIGDAKAIDSVSGRIDTMLVAGGIGAHTALSDTVLLSGLNVLARRSRRFGSVCTGAFVLAAAGLLDGRSATTHWASAERLQSQYPAVNVQHDRIFVNDGPVWTSAGVTAGIDLALELVTTDHGPAIAREVSRLLVVYMRRPGGQTQFSVHLAAPPDHTGIRDLQRWMSEHPTDDLSVKGLAERLSMSERTFQRTFLRESGVTPGRFAEQVRVEHARKLLEEGDLPIPAIAVSSGFRSAETLYRSFRRQLDCTPAHYRRHFARHPPLNTGPRPTETSRKVPR